jgi:hypothetical protein
MSTIDLALIIAAIICFVIDTFSDRLNVNTGINLTALGLALWALSVIV